MNRDMDPSTEQGLKKGDQDLLDDLHRLEAVLDEEAEAPELAVGTVDVHAA